MDLTPEELALISTALAPVNHPAYKKLAVKIHRLQLIGHPVRFLDDRGQEQTGTLSGYRTWQGSTRAEISSKGFLYLVDPDTELIGPARD